MLEQVGLAELARRPIGRLSGGQRQRVLVARALANEPALLLLDEPTTGVDIGTTEGLFDLLDRLHIQGMTILVVSHDVGVVALGFFWCAALLRQSGAGFPGSGQGHPAKGYLLSPRKRRL